MLHRGAWVVQGSGLSRGLDEPHAGGADYIGGVDHGAGRVDVGAETVRMTAFVHGRVQGVGFRWWTRARALELGLSGSATNLSGGRVQVVAEGARSRCEQLLEHLRGGQTPGVVVLVVEQYAGPRGETGFVER
jgi:acylphosphatase